MLYKVYNGSLVHLVCTIYSEYEWLPWRFAHVPEEYWNDLKNQRNFMDWAGKQINYTNKEDWYKVTKEV